MRLTRLIIPITAVTLFVGCTPADKKIENDLENDLIEAIEGVPFNAKATNPLTQDEFNGWFVSGKVTKNGMVSAANSMDFANTNNSDFYKWSYRMFLWITSPKNENTRVFDSQTFYDVAPANSNNKRALIKHEPGVFRNFSPQLLQTRNKSLGLDEVEQGQAGGSDVLMTKNGSLVYYTLMVNDVMAVYRTMNPGNNKLRLPSDSSEMATVVEFGKDILGVDIEDPNALAMELKLSWVEASSLSNPEDYVKIDAIIPTYAKDKENKMWVSTGDIDTVQLALTGMHVVGNTKGHPEMLWATFEHGRNTPQDTYNYVNTDEDIVTVPFSSEGDYLFCKSGASKPANESHMSMHYTEDTIFAKDGFTISASNTKLDHAWGAASDTTPNPLVTSVAESNSEVISLNSSVIGMLEDGDVRKNYILIGCTWTQNGGYPYSGYGEVNYPIVNGDTVKGLGAAVGTSRLANSTMETYMQADNCFNCHNNYTKENTVLANQKKGGYLSLSHIYSDLIGLPIVKTKK